MDSRDRFDTGIYKAIFCASFISSASIKDSPSAIPIRRIIRRASLLVIFMISPFPLSCKNYKRNRILCQVN